MKKLLLISIILIASSQLYAQNNKHEINLSYGILSHDQVLDITADIFTEVFTLGYATDKSYDTNIGPAFITYRFYPLSWLSTGITAGVDIANGKLLDDTEAKVGTFRRTAISFAFENHFRYVRTGIFQMYSGYGIGYTLRKYSDKYDAGVTSEYDYNHVAFNITGLGFRFGKKIGGYLELGYGYKGLICAGINYQF